MHWNLGEVGHRSPNDALKGAKGRAKGMIKAVSKTAFKTDFKTRLHMYKTIMFSRDGSEHTE